MPILQNAFWEKWCIVWDMKMGNTNEFYQNQQRKEDSFSRPCKRVILVHEWLLVMSYWLF